MNDTIRDIVQRIVYGDSDPVDIEIMADANIHDAPIRRFYIYIERNLAVVIRHITWKTLWELIDALKEKDILHGGTIHHPGEEGTEVVVLTKQFYLSNPSYLHADGRPMILFG